MSRLHLTILCLLLALAGCMEGTKEPRSRSSLYDQLKTDGINAVVDDFVARVKADTKLENSVRRPFLEKDTEALNKQLVAQISEAAGSPYAYGVHAANAPHNRPRLTAEDFKALAEDLKEALKNKGVSDKDIEGVLERLTRSSAQP